MPILVGGGTAGTSGSNVVGGMSAVSYDFNVIQRLYLPPGVRSLNRNGSAFTYQERQYGVGMYSQNVVVDEHLRVSPQGAPAPQAAPGLSVGAGATDQIGYISYYDELTDERTSISAGTAVTGNTTRSWSSLPTTVPGEVVIIEGTATFVAGAVTGTKTNFGDLRPGDKVAVSTALNRYTTIRSITDDTHMTVDDTGIASAGVSLVHKPVSRYSHVELWVAVAGALPRLAARVPLGTTSFSEATATLLLGEAFIDNFEPMPNGSMSVAYADRQLIAGNFNSPDELFLSQTFFPERYGGTSFKTRFGEPITGLVKMRDYVLVLTPNSSYILQGYSEDDLTFTVSEPELGGFGHTCNVVVWGKAYIPNNRGYWLFNGAWHQLITDRLTEWQESYKTYSKAFENAWTVYNPDDLTIQFMPRYVLGGGQGTDQTTEAANPEIAMLNWILNIDGVASDDTGSYGGAAWSNDDVVGKTQQQINTPAWVLGAYLTPEGKSVGKFYRINGVGELYYEDKTVAAESRMIIQLQHTLMGDPGGDRKEGKQLKRLWVYARSEMTDMVVRVYAGDEWSAPGYNATLPPVSNAAVNPVPPGGGTFSDPATRNNQTGVPGDFDYLGLGPNVIEVQWAPMVTHVLQPGKVVGRGFTFYFQWESPLYVSFYGVGGLVGPGDAYRGVRYTISE